MFLTNCSCSSSIPVLIPVHSIKLDFKYNIGLRLDFKHNIGLRRDFKYNIGLRFVLSLT